MPRYVSPCPSSSRKIWYHFQGIILNALYRSIYHVALPLFRPDLFVEPSLVKRYPSFSQLPVFLFLPSGNVSSTEKNALYIDLHGGGFIYGSPKKDFQFCQSLQISTGCIVASLSYPFGPASRFRNTLDTTASLIQNIISDPVLNIDASNIVLGGFSAGGNLAMALPQLDELRGVFKAVVSFYPLLDFSLTFDELGETNKLLKSLESVCIWGHVGEGQATRIPVLSPVYADPAVFPSRMCVVLAEKDLLCGHVEEWFWKTAENEGARLTQVEVVEGVRKTVARMDLLGEWLCVKVLGVGHSFTHRVPRGKGEGERKTRERVRACLRDVEGWVGQVFGEGIMHEEDEEEERIERPLTVEGGFLGSVFQEWDT